MEIDFFAILKSMVRIRMVEQYIAKRYPEQQMKCPTHLCVGQEAVPAVFGALTKPQDIFTGTYRSHGHYLAKGGDLTALFAELLGKPDGCSKGFGGSMHLIDTKRHFIGTSAIVASGIAIAAGAALSLKYRKEPSIAVAFFGDAALEEGVAYETANFASLHKLPLLMVCENNQLAVSTPLRERQASTTLYNRFSAMGVRGKKVKENDLQELIRIGQGEVKNIRDGYGPAFIEYRVSRWSVHVGHDIQGPTDLWWTKPFAIKASGCPVARLIRYLLKEKKITMLKVQGLREQIQHEIENAYGEASSLPSFRKTNVRRYVYASPLASRLPSRRKVIMAAPEFISKAPSKLVNPF